MKRSKLILLVDGENILHQSFHKFENLKSSSGKPSGAIFGFFKSLHMYINRFNPNKVIVTFDNGHSSFRLKLNPNYKIHRQDISYDRESLSCQKQVIIKTLSTLRIPYVYDKNNKTNYEGDDFLAKLALKYSDDNLKVLIVSSDKDFNQLLTHKGIKIYNPRKESYVTSYNCKELFGYSPKETVPYLCMVGDNSDDIKGIKGVGPVKARQYLDKHSNDFWSKFLYNLSPESKEIMIINRQLIDLEYFLNEFPDVEIPIKTYEGKKINYSRFLQMCCSYSLNSFKTPEFIKVFENLIK